MASDDSLQQQTCQNDKPQEGGSCCPLKSAFTRRDFLRMFVGVFAVMWGALAAYPLLNYLTAKEKDNEAEAVTSVSLGAADAFAPNSAKNFKFGSKPAIVYRDAAGEFSAYSAICTHLGCTVQYKPSDDQIICACHGGVYEPGTGTNVAGPPPKPLNPLSVSVNNGELIVSRA